jgi:hypothetical protein
LHEGLNAFSRMGVKEMCVVILVKVVWIGQTILTMCATFPRVDGDCVGDFIQPLEYSAG